MGPSRGGIFPNSFQPGSFCSVGRLSFPFLANTFLREDRDGERGVRQEDIKQTSTHATRLMIRLRNLLVVPAVFFAQTRGVNISWIEAEMFRFQPADGEADATGAVQWKASMDSKFSQIDFIYSDRKNNGLRHKKLIMNPNDFFYLRCKTHLGIVFSLAAGSHVTHVYTHPASKKQGKTSLLYA